MSANLVPDSVKRFLFDYIDSVEQLEILLFLWSHKERDFTLDEIFRTLRTNVESIRRRVEALVVVGVVKTGTAAPPSYRFNARSAADDELLDALANAYRVRPHRVLEILFSSAKRARPFADAFRLVQPKRDDDDC